MVHPYAGRPRDKTVPEIDGPAAVRLLGWSPWNEAVIAVAVPAGGAEPAGIERGAGALGLGHVGLTDYDRISSTEARRRLRRRP